MSFIKNYNACITKDIRYPANLKIGEDTLASTGVKVVDGTTGTIQ